MQNQSSVSAPVKKIRYGLIDEEVFPALRQFEKESAQRYAFPAPLQIMVVESAEAAPRNGFAAKHTTVYITRDELKRNGDFPTVAADGDVIAAAPEKLSEKTTALLHERLREHGRENAQGIGGWFRSIFVPQDGWNAIGSNGAWSTLVAYVAGKLSGQEGAARGTVSAVAFFMALPLFRFLGGRINNDWHDKQLTESTEQKELRAAAAAEVLSEQKASGQADKNPTLRLLDGEKTPDERIKSLQALAGDKGKMLLDQDIEKRKQYIEASNVVEQVSGQLRQRFPDVSLRPQALQETIQTGKIAEEHKPLVENYLMAVNHLEQVRGDLQRMK